MFLRSWILLFLVFISYTIYLYLYCDPGNNRQVHSNVIAGRNIWQNKNCQACHQIYGLGGYMGPDLTNIISRKGAKNASVFIRYGSGKMPDLHLSDKEVKEVVAYLSWIDKSGSSYVPQNKVHWTGTYIIDNDE